MRKAAALSVPERWGIEARLMNRVLAGGEAASLLDRLKPQHFSHPGQKELCAFLQARRRSGLPVDLPSVTDALMVSDPQHVVDRLGGWEMLGGPGLLDSSLLSGDAIDDYLRALRRASLGDQELEAMRDLAAAIEGGDLARQGALRGSLQRIFAQSDEFDAPKEAPDGSLVPAGPEVWSQALLGIERDMVDEAGPAGLRFGLPPLDEFLQAGLRAGRLWVIGAGTGEGKTALALMMAMATARSGVGVLYLSYEMTGAELLERTVALETNIPWWRIQRRQFTNADKEVLLGWSPPPGLLLPLVSGVPIQGLPRLVRSGRTALGEHQLPLGLVVVDHLQLMHSALRVESRALEVKEAADRCKELALGGAGGPPLAVLALSQLRRARDTSSPKLSDLKESGGIEEAADTVLLLVRERMGGRMGDEARIEVAKNRGGPVGRELRLTFDGAHARFC